MPPPVSGEMGFGRGLPGRQSFREIGRATVAWASTAPHGIQGDGCGLHGARGGLSRKSRRGALRDSRWRRRWEGEDQAPGADNSVRSRSWTRPRCLESAHARWWVADGRTGAWRKQQEAAARKAPRVNGVLAAICICSCSSQQLDAFNSSGGPVAVPPRRTMPSIHPRLSLDRGGHDINCSPPRRNVGRPPRRKCWAYPRTSLNGVDMPSSLDASFVLVGWLGPCLVAKNFAKWVL